MTRTRAEAFNEWMRRYTEDPTAFEAEFQTVGLFLKEEYEGENPTYGDFCAAYLALLEAGDESEGGVQPPPEHGDEA